ncbi:MAG: (4Fe-4S)-binding protein [Desulfococcus sp. 4484_241]|nr:MAG: (4Fe-4S)-binding protein [Desulfococcus sp. 4484_241]
MVISVASGKGGTGKTTVATNLAVALGPYVRLLDCDVEEPNAHLFLKPSIESVESLMTFVPAVSEEKCTYCRKCAEICRFKAIAVLGKTVITFPELCHSCYGCQEVCPEGAVYESSRKIGVVEKGRGLGDVEFVHGRLQVGEAMSPPLIKKVRSFEDHDGVTIIDAPPGTSCPVIAAVKGVDFVVMVTEPTPFGLHDLKLGVGAVRLLGLPCGLVINRSDIGNKDVKKYAKDEGIPVLMEIPFDRRIAETYSRGRLIVEESREWKERFIELYERIIRLTGKESHR